MLSLAVLTIVVTLLGFFGTTLDTNPGSLRAFVVLFVIAFVVDAVWRGLRTGREAGPSVR